jgi:hypothetical protein
MPIAIFGYKFINEMINEDEKAAEMSVQYPYSGLGNLRLIGMTKCAREIKISEKYLAFFKETV